MKQIIVKNVFYFTSEEQTKNQKLSQCGIKSEDKDDGSSQRREKVQIENSFMISFKKEKLVA